MRIKLTMATRRYDTNRLCRKHDHRSMVIIQKYSLNRWLWIKTKNVSALVEPIVNDQSFESKKNL